MGVRLCPVHALICFGFSWNLDGFRFSLTGVLGLVGSILAVCIGIRVPCNIVGELLMVGYVITIAPWLCSFFPIDNVWGQGKWSCTCCIHGLLHDLSYVCMLLWLCVVPSSYGCLVGGM